MLRHVVIWSMQPGCEDDLAVLLDELRRLPDSIEQIEGLSCGPLLNESRHHAALSVDVADGEALSRYRSHPAHQPVLVRLREVAAELVVADYEF
jgi:hypothetical protein